MSIWSRLKGLVGYQADTLGPGESRLGELTVQQVHTFNALLNTFSRTFSFRYDEAMRQDPAFALKMRRDPYLRALLQERLMPLTRWKWCVEAEDPTNKDEEERAKWYEACIRATPKFSKQRLYLGHAAWYGRYGSQVAFAEERIAGKKGWRVHRHRPVNGDKIVFDWDGEVGVRINSMAVPKYPRELITYDDRGGPILMLKTPEFRQKFVLHEHELDDADYFEPEMAGRVHGIGLRDFAYYGAWLRQEMIRWALNFMEKVGTLGILMIYYPEGNDPARKQAEETAKQASNRNAIAVPLPKGADKKSAGMELIPANMTGVQFLVDIISAWWEKHVERLFVGQSMSAGADDSSGLGGTGRAELAKDTKFNLLQFDACGQDETYTTDLLHVLCDLNGDSGWRPRFKSSLPDPEAEAKLNAITKAASLPGKKLTYKASEVRELVGMSEPGPDDEIVGGEDVQLGPDGQPLQPGADPNASPSGVSGDAGESGDILDTLFGWTDQAEPSQAQYAANEWQPHTLKSGPNKGKAGVKNVRTGEVRDRAPADRQARQDGGKGADGPHPSAGREGSGGGFAEEAQQHTRGLLARGGSVAHALKEKVSGWVAEKYQSLRQKYGDTGAKLVMGGMVLMAPIPLPGTALIPVALAEGVRRLRDAMRGQKGAAAAKPASVDPTTAAKRLIAELYTAHGEQAPQFDTSAARMMADEFGGDLGGGEQSDPLDGSASEFEEQLSKDRDPGHTPTLAERSKEVDEWLGKMRSKHTDEELKELAKRVTGRGGRTAKQALDYLRIDLLAVVTAVESQKV